MNNLTPELFNLKDTSNWKSHLEQHGYVVISDILETSEYAHIFQQFAKDWNHVSPNFDFKDKKTWTTTNCPMMWAKGMIYASGLGQSDFMWKLRTNKRILEIWSQVHNTTDLVTSFDGFSVFLDVKQKPKTWLHVDQKSDDSIYSVQGAYNFLPVLEKDAGFVVVPDSHRTFISDPKNKGNFIVIPEDDEHIEKAVKLLIPENCFVLWNSKTIHANVGMEKPKQQELNRLTVYIAMFPKEQRTADVLAKRLVGYKEGHNCGHFAIRHDVKKHPYGLKARYESRGFNMIEPRLTEDKDIPEERLNLI